MACQHGTAGRRGLALLSGTFVVDDVDEIVVAGDLEAALAQ
jgi:hypothetical protein